ncbi:MAG TPA: M28 family peptidase [Blastocatellia bacterium]|nr:M28 family peptidase [Blastocatellia bacterium]
MNCYRRMRRGPALVLLAALLLASAAGASNMPLPPSEVTSSITKRDLRKHLSFLASDELGGRYTLSQGSRIAARYLATELESYGYKGAARDGSFFQKVPLSYRNVNMDKSLLTLNVNGARQQFKYGDDFASETPANTDIGGELVFVGYGISAPKVNHDDYQGMDVKGKIAVAVGNLPDALKKAGFDDKQQTETAASRGAAALIIIAPPFYMANWAQIKGYIARETATLPPPPAGKFVPVIFAGPELSKALGKAMGKEESYLLNQAGAGARPAAIPATAELKIDVVVKDAPPAYNVVGVLEGSDAKLKDEYVIFSSHYDHLKARDNGEVYNGADDDGSGTVAVLEIAQALSLGERARRSILIVFHTGEEMGLLGSEFNVDYEPAVPLTKLVADFNIDMIGRSREPGNNDQRDKELTDKDSVYVIGADKLSTELNRISEQTNAETARLKFDYTYNDENHPQQFYYRSDHYNYAKHGIPIIFYFTGVHRDYHMTTDDIEKIDFDKVERISRLILATGWRVANLDHRLVVDKKPAPAPAPAAR